MFASTMVLADMRNKRVHLRGEFVNVNCTCWLHVEHVSAFVMCRFGPLAVQSHIFCCAVRPDLSLISDLASLVRYAPLSQVSRGPASSFRAFPFHPLQKSKKQKENKKWNGDSEMIHMPVHLQHKSQKWKASISNTCSLKDME